MNWLRAPLFLAILALGGWSCSRAKPTAVEEGRTGSILVETEWENSSELAGAAKIPIAKGKVRVSGVGMATPREAESLVAGGRLKLRLEGIPIGTRRVELYLLSAADDTLWKAVDDAVNVLENLTAKVVLRPGRVGDAPPDTVRISASHLIDRVGRPFTFQVMARDAHDPDDSLDVSWDFEGDGSYTEWSLAKQGTHAYGAVGNYLVVVQVRDRTGKINSNTVGLAQAPVRVRVIDLIAQAGLKGLDRDTAVVAISGGGRVDLDGKASQGLPASLSDTLIYHWKHLPKYPGAFSFSIENTFNANNSRDAGLIRFTPSEAGLYAFSLSVEYAGVFSDPDTLLMQVRSRPPTARVVAPDTMRVGDEVRLQGIGADPDDPSGNTLAYRWRGVQVGLLSDSTSSAPTFVPTQEGVYTFELVVKDTDPQESQPDRVEILVLPANRAPVADAGPDASGFTGAEIALDGSGSRDPDPVDQPKLVYQWASLDGPTLSDNTSPRPVFSADAPGEYRFVLVVGDGLLFSRPDTVVVTLAQENRPPVAQAGEDTVAQAGEVVRLDGGGSSDPDGGPPLQYQWRALDGGTLSDETLPAPGFASVQPGAFHIQLVVSDGQLASAPDTVQVRVRELPRLVFAAREGGDYELFSSRLDGSDRVNLSQQPGDDDRRPRVSPDGLLIAFISNRNHSADPWIEGAEAPDIWGMDRDGGNQRQLVPDPADWPALASDHSLAFARIYGLEASDVFVLDTSEVLPELLSDQSGQNTQPSWSPDSRRLVFAKADSSGISDLFLVNRDGSGLEQLTDTPDASEAEPSWSPDGGRIAFVTDAEGTNNIAVIELPGRAQRLLTADAGADHLSPAWTPDGAGLAYVRQDLGGETDIYLMDADGSNPRLIVENAEDPAWLPGR